MTKGSGDGLTRRDALKAGGAAALAMGGLAAMPRFSSAASTAGPPAYAVGFESLSTEYTLPRLSIEGSMPTWLGGALLRNGPAQFEVGERQFNHWFDGLAMLHAFSFKSGQVGYANRFLRSSAYDAWKQRGRIEYSEFGTDPCRAIFSGVSSVSLPIPIIADVPNANVSLERWAGKFRALTEMPVPVRFDAKTLATLGPIPGAGSQMGTAHPHQDPATHERFSYETVLVGKTGVNVYSEKGTTKRRLAFIPQAKPRYMHSFSITKRFVILFTQPFEVDPAGFLSGPAKPIIEHFAWNGSEASRVVVIDRAKGGVVGTFEVPPFFVFHHINAFETGSSKIEMDVSGHTDSSIIDALYLRNLRSADQRMPRITVKRITIDLRARKASVRPLSDTDLELPRVDYDSRNGKSYRYAYGIGQQGESSGFVDRLAKLDVTTGNAVFWKESGCYPGEPVFIPRSHQRREDDGVVLSVVLDAAKRTSFLLVLEAASFTERARAVVPHRIPFGFHGLHTPAV